MRGGGGRGGREERDTITSVLYTYCSQYDCGRVSR